MMSFHKIAISFFTLLNKEVKRVLRIWPQTLIPPLITTSLYFIIFGGILFNNRLMVVAGLEVPYTVFLFPGLIIMSVITNAYNSPVSSLFTTKMFKKH